MVPSNNSSDKLIALLQSAYSGERAAAYAYRGHWQSVSEEHDRDSIRAIEEDEWRHRQLVGEMLAGFGAEPSRRREVRATIIGRTLGLLCHVTGWLMPMYGAGKLESRNVKEYETAARYARDCGCVNLIDCLLEMAEVEWDHEKYFRSCVLSHRLGRRLSLWPHPPPRETIRSSYESESGGSLQDKSRDLRERAAAGADSDAPSRRDEMFIDLNEKTMAKLGRSER